MPTHTPEYVAALEAALHKWEPLSGQGDIRQTLAFKDGFDAAWNAALAAHPGQPEPRAEVTEASRRYPDVMTAELRDVLGRPNFWCGPIAHEMRAAGADIKTKAEDEQAHVLHWLVKLVLDHGAEWQPVAAEELRAIRNKADAARTGASS
ncbi:hypothetical protein [Burkholderia cepacia]|uniref:hypothetical protein n=1 Tax=Burkholderia cepacia TaxID=292 RepID=UPI001CF1FF3E|nr:hypothetical protein [Burkholderia cepacia]MCA8324066.1 hypothetical protein [Burkholderia cepacia]